MIKSKVIFNILLLIEMFTFCACSFHNPKPGKQVWMDDGYTNKVVDGYWLYLPRTYVSEKDWPIILFLQGGYGSSPNPRTSKEDGPAKYAIDKPGDVELAHYVKDSFIIINPHMKVGPSAERQWYQHAEQLIQILDEVTQQYSGDRQRLYLTGLSRGGHGSWELVKKFPDKFAAMIQISGRITCRSGCDKIASIPMWIVHNTGDEVVEYEYAENAVIFFKSDLGISFARIGNTSLTNVQLNSSHIFTSFDNNGHDAWNRAYTSVDLYRWLLSKKKQ